MERRGPRPRRATGGVETQAGRLMELRSDSVRSGYGLARSSGVGMTDSPGNTHLCYGTFRLKRCAGVPECLRRVQGPTFEMRERALPRTLSDGSDGASTIAGTADVHRPRLPRSGGVRPRRHAYSLPHCTRAPPLRWRWSVMRRQFGGVPTIPRGQRLTILRQCGYRPVVPGGQRRKTIGLQ